MRLILYRALAKVIIKLIIRLVEFIYLLPSLNLIHLFPAALVTSFFIENFIILSLLTLALYLAFFLVGVEVIGAFLKFNINIGAFSIVGPVLRPPNYLSLGGLRGLELPFPFLDFRGHILI